ncbi:site-specific integrase [Diaminobutyricibacter tongyongensis]|uniref:Site-specific integrase n=1 Tax=Leifsonia tongyongensis TaxID=1268043 RepID=A0A6L9Y2G9_9MICO|nr:site-specific integrase [Diaminobutyricibacter tongyongensis]NEN07607.1 site-specific integrase [Diaminobutyricibacter tongyongensis]
MSADIYRRCGCRDENKRQFASLPVGASPEQIARACPLLVSDPKHGKWGFYLAGGVDPRTGKRLQIRQATFSTKAEAQKARNAEAVKLDRGTYVAPTKEVYADYLAKWLPRRAVTGKGLAATTLDNYARYIRNDIAPSALGRMKLTDIRRFHINAFVAEQMDAGRGATTIRRMAAVIQGSLRAAEKSALIDHNPSLGIELPAVESKKVKVWEPDQVGVFLDTAAKHRLSALFETVVFTGLRRGEAIGLRWSDVDMTKRRITVANNRTQAGPAIVEGDVKTVAGQNRVIDIDDTLAGVLIAWKLTQQQEADEWGEAYRDSGYIFTYENGEPLKPQYATRLFDKLRVKAKLPKLTFHGQRHENASLMIASGTDIAVVSKRLGHTSVGITSDIYGHLIGSASRDAAERAAAIVPRKAVTAHTLHTHEAL